MKEFTVNIKEAHAGTFKVSMSDHNGNSGAVYEMSVEAALNYAKEWFAKAEERQQAKYVMSKAIAQCIKLDKQAGITTKYRDCLD
tara:strand:- start:228 stop:482 length:255 start_codon:yes stop_codon:yes gene_type:complete